MFIIIRLCICFHLSYTYLYNQKTHLQLQITKAVLITCLRMENQPLAWKIPRNIVTCNHRNVDWDNLTI